MRGPHPFLDRSAEGGALRYLRIGFVFSKRELEAATGISRGRLAVAEAGLTQLSLPEIDAIARAFEMSPAEVKGELRQGRAWPTPRRVPR